MFIKCLLFAIFLRSIDAQNEYLWRSSSSCRLPRFENGRLRVRSRSKMIKFICNNRYELVGNRYSTCKSGEWDEPVPVCVRPGCPILHNITNGINMYTHHGAWMVAFCIPGHKLIGSPAMYCDGNRWNGTMPTCVDSTATAAFSCDFEAPDLCGWMHDEFHDFDWRRINKHTPSHYLLTGPSYDHTFGPGGSGHYMYIESSTRLENDTARLLSPIYNASVASGGCFSFFYHMFGKDTGGLRVYQKPDDLQLSYILSLNESEKQKYVLFEQWGNLGDTWYSAVVNLVKMSSSFQIVIEGVRGRSFTSDIAIDDVAIFHGENCTEAKKIATTPLPSLPATCSDRCDLTGDNEFQVGCSCALTCLSQSSCCFDFIELCLFNSINGSKLDDDSSQFSTTVEVPETQKLVASTESTSTTTTPRPIPRITSTTRRTTAKTTPKTTPTTTTTTTTTTPVPTTRKPTTITPRTTRSTTTVRTSTKPTTRITKATTKPIPIKPMSVPTTTTTTESTMSTTTMEGHIAYHDMIDDKIQEVVKTDTKKGYGALKTAVITVVVLACLCAAVMAVVFSRSFRGQQTIARLRGITREDPEVRYLSNSLSQ